MSTRLKIFNGRIISPYRIIPNGTIVVTGETITAIAEGDVDVAEQLVEPLLQSMPIEEHNVGRADRLRVLRRRLVVMDLGPRPRDRLHHRRLAGDVAGHVGDDGEGGDHLEARLRPGVLGHVGVVLPGELAVGLLDRLGVGIARHAECRVVVLVFHGRPGWSVQ